jgi:hypothetical protein
MNAVTFFIGIKGEKKQGDPYGNGTYVEKLRVFRAAGNT